jgi:hypothetical protein
MRVSVYVAENVTSGLEMRVSVNFKQELHCGVGKHQLQRLDIKDYFENTEILKFFARS